MNHVGGVTYNIWDHVAVVGANLVCSFLNLDPLIFNSTDLSLQPTPPPYDPQVIISQYSFVYTCKIR